MKTFFLVILFGLMSILGGASKTLAEIQWTTFEKGLPQARKEKKPILIDIYTDWCRWCKVMDSKTYAKDDIADLVTHRFVAVKMNGESKKKVIYQSKEYEERALGRKLRVRGFPTTVILDKEGNMIGSIPGYIEAGEFLKMLKYVESGAYRKMKYDEFVKKK